jgi:hypothetical protein
MYQLINKNTNAIVGKYKTIKTARRARDRKDNEYGAYVHRVIEIKQ